MKTSSHKIFYWIILTFSVSVFFSCANEDCVSISNNYYLVGFFGSERNTAGQYPKIDTLFYSVKADGNDIVFYDPDTTISVLSLPVNPAADKTSFELIMLDSITYDESNDPIYHINPNPHRISVSYRRTQRIISVDCGAEISYTSLMVDEITFVDTVVVSDKLSRLNDTNIEVYF